MLLKEVYHFNISEIMEITNFTEGIVKYALADARNGRGFTWGLSHFINAGTANKGYSIIARFDCDLSLDYDEPAFKNTGVWHKPDVYFAQGMGSINKHPEGRGAKK